MKIAFHVATLADKITTADIAFYRFGADGVISPPYIYAERRKHIIWPRRASFIAASGAGGIQSTTFFPAPAGPQEPHGQRSPLTWASVLTGMPR